MSNIKMDKNRILIICIGNIGRSDDGLGWCFADMLLDTILPDITIEYRYQLQVEDALIVSEYPIVIFVDATEEPLENGYSISTCMSSTHYFYSSHIQSPENILYLAETLYHKRPEAIKIAIEGENWELGMELSEKAKKNLQKAFFQFEIFMQTQYG
jgi:hydrogenase maturation protease